MTVEVFRPNRTLTAGSAALALVTGVALVATWRDAPALLQVLGAVVMLGAGTVLVAGLAGRVEFGVDTLALRALAGSRRWPYADTTLSVVGTAGNYRSGARAQLLSLGSPDGARFAISLSHYRVRDADRMVELARERFRPEDPDRDVADP